jgi:hypothetical protein
MPKPADLSVTGLRRQYVPTAHPHLSSRMCARLWVRPNPPPRRRLRSLAWPCALRCGRGCGRARRARPGRCRAREAGRLDHNPLFSSARLQEERRKCPTHPDVFARRSSVPEADPTGWPTPSHEAPVAGLERRAFVRTRMHATGEAPLATSKEGRGRPTAPISSPRRPLRETTTPAGPISSLRSLRAVVNAGWISRNQ